jgi:predicted phage-related endonuclease
VNQLLTVTAAAVQHQFTQGSERWLAHRYNCNNASDAAAMLSVDPNRSRTDLLDALYIGFQQDVSEFKQGIYADGHHYEERARPLAEVILGEDLYPLVLSRDWSEHGIKRPLGASLDGYALAKRKNWEHKSLNEVLAEAMPYAGDAGVHLNDGKQLPLYHRIQMEAQFMCNPQADACLFTASKWAGDTLIEARHCWYYPDPELREAIVAGWVQFEADLATHQPREVKERPVAETVDALPVLFARIEGRVTDSNLQGWLGAMNAQLKTINRTPKTDQEFANAKAMVTKLEEGGKKLLVFKEQVLAGAGDILELMQSIDAVKKTMDDTRLELDRQVKAQELLIRKEIADGARRKLEEYMAKLDARLADLTPKRVNVMPEPSHPKIAADFDKAIKNKRTIKSLHDSVDAELARAKIAAGALADDLEANLKVLRSHQEHAALFADWRALIFKAPDHCALEASNRVRDHLAEQERKAREAQERQEREAEAQRQREAAAAQRAARQEVGPADGLDAGAPEHAAAAGSSSYSGMATRDSQRGERDFNAGDQRETHVVPLLGGEVRPLMRGERARQVMPTNIGPEDGARVVVDAEVARSGEMVRLGEIGDILAIGLTKARMAGLGFEPAREERNAAWFHREDLASIIDALIRDLARRRNELHLLTPGRVAA